MKFVPKIAAMLLLCAAPLFAEAHPGHDGVPIHSLQIVWVLLAAISACKYSSTVVRYVLRRTRRVENPTLR